MKAILVANGRVGSSFGGPNQRTCTIQRDQANGCFFEIGGLFNRSKVLFRKQVKMWRRITDPAQLAALTGMALGARYGAGAGPLGALIGMGIGAAVAGRQASGKSAISMHVQIDAGALMDYTFVADHEVIECLLAELPAENESKG